MQGRVFTLFGSLIALASPLGLSLAGPISDGLGLQIWYLAGGVLALGISASFALIPVVRHMERHNADTLLRVEQAELAPVEAA
jgi:hypothetical protein